VHIAYWWESQDRDHWEDQDVCWWTILSKMDVREIGWYGMDWTDVAQDRNQWRALVNTVLKFRVP
jgi:hypothetical protein